ncbi:CheY chemotaxis protein or a CheY-like REC (receiver) domain [Methylorubrum salsuginis]|uniref:CheY chemotaxis protein or a CheY-like REC (Receiver) domain n=1 Tax=Methylorubrum salsuginis TaxID=414703 RepID=A0A1I4JK91_9HYPH|nr:CheY chemotaxis protein or a CheY-like REC (receiver) domain [Methylorubrum salsuginis]
MPVRSDRDSDLRDRRVLVVEDDYFWADELAGGLRRAGVAVLGPTGTLASALALLAPEPELDGAVIDMNLRGERADPLVDRLLALRVPVLLVTGYECSSLSVAHAGLPCLEKPVALAPVLNALSRLLPPR